MRRGTASRACTSSTAACRTRCSWKCSPTRASAPSSAASSVRLARLPPSRRVWIFDLDNTLHDARPGIFPLMHAQINAYLRRRFGLDEAAANAMRRDFWLRYGTTLHGLMRHYGEDPREFLRETHRF